MLNYNVELEVQSAFFVGDGKKLSNIDYIYVNNTIYILDNRKLIKTLKEKNKLNEFYDKLSEGGNTYSIIKNNINLEKVCSFKINNIRVKPLEIKTHIRNAFEEVYIPGSTLKGAIRIAITYTKMLELKKNNPKKYQEQVNKLLSLMKNERNKDSIDKEWSNFENLLFDGQIKEYFSCIQVTDTLELKNLNIEYIDKKEYTLNGQKSKKINTYRECLSKGTISKHEIVINNHKEITKDLTLEYILECLDNFIDYQIEIIDYFESWYEKNIEYDFSNSNMLVSGGSGYFNKTLLYAFEENQNEIIKFIANKENGSEFKRKVKDTVMSPRTLKRTYDNLLGVALLKECKNDL